MPEAAAAAGGSAAGAKPSAVPLDDVMLAMDVVDTLRHADRLVERELSSDERDKQLKERLRQIYASQGIEVPDHVLEDGVAALKEERFVYDPPTSGGGRWWATVWIRRKRWIRVATIGLAMLVVVGAGYYFFVKMPAEREVAERASELQTGLPQKLAGELDRIRTTAKVEEAITRAEALAAQGMAAAKAGDAETSRSKAAELQGLREKLDQEYVIRVVSQPNQPSGVFRIPQDNPNARNFYLIVEAVDPQGQLMNVPVTSEEDNTTRSVHTWGLGVDQNVFDRVRDDKNDDGIIQNNLVGAKRRGYVEPEYATPTTGGTILEW